MSRTILDFTPEGLKRRLADMERQLADIQRRGGWQFDRELEPAGGSFATRNNAQLLVMTASSESIASGGDYVTFTGLASQHGFASMSGAGDSWTHETGGVYTLTYEHIWDTYGDGGTIALELDGVVQTSNVIAAGTSGQSGRGTISYIAGEGQVGKIKVTQSSGSAQTCDATVWIALPDPTDAEPSGAVSVVLLIDGVQVATASGDLGVDFSSATMFMGQPAASASASSFTYDAASITKNAAELLGNGGFESATFSAAQSTAVATGNWRPYRQDGESAPARVTSPVYAGTYAGQVVVDGGSNENRYFFQDVDISPGDHFDVEVRVYRGSGEQKLGVFLDWNRATTWAHEAIVTMNDSGTSFAAFGLAGTGPALPAGQWSLVTLRIGVVA